MKKSIAAFSIFLLTLSFFAVSDAAAESSEEQLQNVLQLLEKGDRVKAAEKLNLLTTIDPKFAPAFLHRGMLFSSEGNNKAALADYERAISLDSKLAEAYVGKSMILFAEGNLEGTLTQLNKAIEINPAMGTAFYNRGMAHYYQGDFRKALFDFDMARSLGEEVEPDIYGEVSVFRDIKASLEKLTLAIEKTPGEALNYYNRGILYYHSQDYKKALKDLEKAGELGLDLEEEMLQEVRLLSEGKKPTPPAGQSILDEVFKPQVQ
ncbi:MAG: tetratricopeptide repeat protein [Candidatus Omnitrophica bacterium]|nr:tetratricopeptide repeat protein [Candidatus Omnitrophota bacterium]